MTKPVIADNKPTPVELDADTEYHWCACGRSKNQPFCDGSHRGTSFTPVAFKPDASGEAWLCMCKHTGSPPYCDGTHARLTEEQLHKGQPVESPSPQDVEPTPEEPTVKRIHDMARYGLSKVGEHGEIVAMGVPRSELPHWDDIQILAAQLATRPLMDHDAVGTELIIGPNANKPLVLDIPLFVSDMSFGSLSPEAKIALARGAELAGTGICSGEGGMMPEEQQANSRYFYELATAMFGYNEDQLTKVQAFHFKGGQAAKTGIGGHLPGAKVSAQIAEVRGLMPGQDAISPPTFAELQTPEDYRRFSDRVREISGGIPIGFKISANHIEKDIDFVLDAGVDYIILDGRGGASGATPRIFRDNISVPTIPALARARRHLDERGRQDITLIATGGLRMPEDFIKALAMGADGVALANSAIQAVGCVAARICNTNNCPSGIATQKPELRARLDVGVSAKRLSRFFESSIELMQLMARGCGHDHLNKFNREDITSWKKNVAELAGIHYAGPQ